jgi:hypothetical protein
MIAPLPNWRSIWLTAASSAWSRSMSSTLLRRFCLRCSVLDSERVFVPEY